MNKIRSFFSREKEIRAPPVKEIEDMQLRIREMLAAIFPEGTENIDGNIWNLEKWIKNMRRLDSDCQLLIDSPNAISKEDVDKLKKRYSETTLLEMESSLAAVHTEDDMEELKAMQLHIEDKLTDTQSRHNMNRHWLEDMRKLGHLVSGVIDYNTKFPPLNNCYLSSINREIVRLCKIEFGRIGIWQEAVIYYRKWNNVVISSTERIPRDFFTHDIEVMSSWIDFMLTRKESKGIKKEAKVPLYELKEDLRSSELPLGSSFQLLKITWEDLRWRFYKLRQIKALRSITKLVNWKSFGCSNRGMSEMMEQLMAMRFYAIEMIADMEGVEIREEEVWNKWQSEMQDLILKADELYSRYNPLQPGEILLLSTLQVDAIKLKKRFFKIAMWGDACLRVTGMLLEPNFYPPNEETERVFAQDIYSMKSQIDDLLAYLNESEMPLELMQGLRHMSEELRHGLENRIFSSSSYDQWIKLKWKIFKIYEQIPTKTGISSKYRSEMMDDIMNPVKNMLCLIKAALIDAENQEIEGEVHQEHQLKLRDLAYGAEDLIGLYDHYLLTRSRRYILSRTIILWKIENSANEWKVRCKKIIELKETMLLLNEPRSRKPSTKRMSGQLPDNADKFVGRDVQLKELRDMLLRRDAVEVMVVLGMAGVGKTTLCQHVYQSIKSYFLVKGWVHVGESFDMLRVANDILNAFTNETSNYCTQLSILEEKLLHILTDKRVLLVLDDVWSQSPETWEKIRSIFSYAGYKSKILITTRSERVAHKADATKIVKLDCLSEEHARLLFTKHAFGNVNIENPPPEELVEIGEAILAKCCGLPLAIKAVGSLLRCNGDDEESWRHISSSKYLWHGDDDLLGPLQLSYQHLPAYLKPCFRFFSLFRKGEEISKNFLAYLWIANSLITIDSGESTSLRQVAYKHMDELVSMSLLEFVEYEGQRNRVKVHDLVHDVALFYSHGEFQNDHLVAANDAGSWTLPSAARHLNLYGCGRLVNLRDATLRTVIVQNGHSPIVPDQDIPHRSLRVLSAKEKGEIPRFNRFNNIRMLCLQDCFYEIPMSLFQLYKLRYLNLSSNPISEIPSLICKLRNLLHLDLSSTDIEELPESVAQLSSLEELDLHECKKLVCLPSGITMLRNLRLLDVSDTRIKYVPSGISKLTKLEYLPYFPLGIEEDHAKVQELKELHLKDRLRIIGLDCLKDEEAKEIQMSRKGQLRDLVLSFSCEGLIERGEEEPANPNEVSMQHGKTLEHLEPNTNTRSLGIRYYQGAELPTWISNRSLRKLVRLELFDLTRCTSLSLLHQLPSLTYLDLHCMESVKTFTVEDDYGSSSTDRIFFPNLEYLSIGSCPGIELLHVYKLAALKELLISSCENLKTLQLSGPVSGGNNQYEGPSLVDMRISWCPRLYFPDHALLPPSLVFLCVLQCGLLKSWCEENRESLLAHIPEVKLQ